MSSLAIWTVIDIVALIAGLAVYLFIVGSQLKAVADDLEHALGDPAEGQLAAALTQLATGSCPAVAKGKQARPDKRAVTHRLIRGPQHEARIVAPVRR